MTLLTGLNNGIAAFKILQLNLYNAMELQFNYVAI